MERTDLTAQPLSFCPVLPPDGEPQPVTRDKEGNIWINIRADHASRAAMRIYEEEYPFERGEDGIWHLKYPFRDGIVYVQLLIDGMEVMTPYLPICYGYSRPYNCIMLEETEEQYDVPEGKNKAAETAGAVDFYRLKDVPHGSVRREYYFSTVTGEWESALVYTPPGYDEDTGRTYPVLYLQHGHGENETGWTAAGKVNFILDNLIAEGRAVPFLVIMNNGMVQTEVSAAPDGSSAVTDRTAAGEKRRVVDHTLFTELLIKDIIPWAQSRFRIGTEKKYRAMAGLSMGSIQTAVTAFTHPEYFSCVGIFSGFLHDFIRGHEQMDMIRRGPSENTHLKALDDPEKFREDFRVFFRGIGKSDPFLDYFMEDEKLLEEKGISCVKKMYEGSHDWNVWRRCICDFAQMIFRE